MQLIYITVILAILCNIEVQAFPKYMRAYNKLAIAVPELKDDCSLCHISSEGGDERNDFGKAYQKEKFKFSKKLINKFPENFLKKLEPLQKS